MNDYTDLGPQFDINILKYAVSMFGILNKPVIFTDSNGQSIVILTDERSIVFQHYVNNKTFRDICCMMEYLLRNSKILIDEVNKTEYDIFDYVTKYNRKWDFNIVEWSKIRPINPLRRGIENTGVFLIKNLDKFLFDIGRSLYGLHVKGYRHGDPTVDNVGINEQGNFMLYDFDFSSILGFLTRKKFIEEDYRKLLRSVKFYIDDKELQAYVRDIITCYDEMLLRMIDVVKEETDTTSEEAYLSLVSKEIIESE